MLEDASRRLGELPDQPQCAVEIEEVIVRKLLTMHDRGSRQVRTVSRRVDIERGALVRILPITQGLAERESKVQTFRKSVRNLGTAGSHDSSEIIGNRLVVCRALLKGRQREPAAMVQLGSTPLADRGDQGVVLVGAGHDRDMRVILGRRPDQCRAANIDVFDGILEAGVRPGDRGLERIQVHHDQVDRLKTLAFERGQVVRNVAASEDSTVDLGMQSLDPTAENLGLTGVIGDLRRL